MHEELYNVSSSPHIRSRLSTGTVMYDVILALLPATFFGVWRFGVHALYVILTSVASALLAEFVVDYLTGRENTLRDGSAVVTGLLLALCLPATVPLYVPYIGAVFAIAVVKGLFGGLGKNFLNPALAGRCFLLLSFGGAMTSYAIDGVTSATPLADLAAGNAVAALQIFTGHAGGVIGCSTFALLLGGLYLWVIDGITWQIPVSVMVSFTLFMGVFGGQSFDLAFLLSHLCGGGLIMAAFFMATDPVTSPVTGAGQVVYGTCVGLLSGLFRVYGVSADSVSYAVILGNLAVPLLDEVVVPKPFAYRASAEENGSHTASTGGVLFLTAVCAVALLAAVYGGTRSAVEERQLADNIATYQAVLPEAESFSFHDGANAALEALDGASYGTDFGTVYINEVVAAQDADGSDAGYIISVTSADGMDGDITLSVGLRTDGSLSGITFTELNETPDIGMKADEPEFKDQFAGLAADRLTLGGNVDGVSGATVTSTAVVNAINAALDFYAANIRAD